MAVLHRSDSSQTNLRETQESANGERISWGFALGFEDCIIWRRVGTSFEDRDRDAQMRLLLCSRN
jgi:hypothetical protein